MHSSKRPAPFSMMESLEQRAFFSVDPTITGVLPASLIATVKNTTSISVILENNGSSIVKGPYTINFYASADQTLDSADTLISSTTKTLASTKPGASKTVKFKLGTVPDVPADGSYFILADVTGAINNSVDSVTASTSTVPITNAFIDLSDTVAITSPAAGKTVLPNGPFALGLVVTNTGNVPVIGSLPIDITRNAEGQASIDEGTTSRSINIKPGKSQTIKLARKVLPGTALGSYSYTATLEPSAKFTNADLSNNAATTPTTLTVANKFPNIIGTFSGPSTVIDGTNAGQTGTLSLTFTTESQGNGVSGGVGILTAADGSQINYVLTTTVATRGTIIGHVFDSTVELTDAFSGTIAGDVLTGKILSSNGADPSISFSLTLVS